MSIRTIKAYAVVRPGGATEPFSYQRTLYDNALRTTYGNYVGSRRDMVGMLAFAAEHHIESPVEIVPFTDANRAIEMVRRGTTPA